MSDSKQKKPETIFPPMSEDLIACERDIAVLNTLSALRDIGSTLRDIGLLNKRIRDLPVLSEAYLEKENSLAPQIKEKAYAIISPEFDDRLEELSNASGLSKSELIQSGVALVELALKAKQQGKKFGVVEQDTPLVTEVVGL
jgi:hypothetical protein